MTVLQKIIKVFTDSKNQHEANQVLFPGESKLYGEVISFIESNLSAEEQQIRDAYRAGQKRESSVIEGGLYEDPESVPDLHTYINQLKKEES